MRDSGPGDPPADKWRTSFHIHWVDGVVVLILVIWWIVGPALFDDGWITTFIQEYGSESQLNIYYEAYNAAIPSSPVYLHLLRLVGGISSTLVWMRVPALAAGLVTWFILRDIVAVAKPHLSRDSSSHGYAALVPLASVFLLGWISWGSTLRSEPIIALALATAIWTAQRFIRSQSIDCLLVWGAALVLAVSIHPTGIVVLAPLFGILPEVSSWYRRHGFGALLATLIIGLGMATIFVVLLWMDSDLGTWLNSADAFGSSGVHRFSWRSELQRYSWLFDPTSGSNSIRRLSVMLVGVAPVLFWTRGRRGRRPQVDVVTVSIVAVAVLLIASPSKWIWHLGVLAICGSAAVAVEWMRLHARDSSGWARQTITAVIIVVPLNAIAWNGGFGWGVVSLVKLDWSQGYPAWLHVDPTSPLLWVLLLGLGVLATFTVLWRRNQEIARPDLFRRAVSGVNKRAIEVVAAFAVFVTVISFAVDGTAAGPGWTIARQNLSNLVGGGSCGLADEVVVTPTDSRSLWALASVESRPLPEGVLASVVPNPPPVRVFPTDGVWQRSAGVLIDGVTTWGSWIDSDTDRGAFASPWYEIQETEGFYISVAGRPTGGDNYLLVEYALLHNGTIGPTAVDALSLPHDHFEWGTYFVQLPAQESSQLNVMRIIGVDNATGPGGWLAFSQPYSAAELITLQSYLSEGAGQLVLIHPFVRSYYPCQRQPPVANGIASVPDIVISNPIPGWSVHGSPLRLLPDVAQIEEIPTHTRTPINVWEFWHQVLEVRPMTATPVATP